MPRQIHVYAANQLHKYDIEEGQEISFDYLPEGRETKPKRIRPVEHATIEKITGRTITAQYQTNGVILKNRLTTRHIVILRRMHGANIPDPTYRVDDFIANLKLGH